MVQKVDEAAADRHKAQQLRRESDQAKQKFVSGVYPCVFSLQRHAASRTLSAVRGRGEADPAGDEAAAA